MKKTIKNLILILILGISSAEVSAQVKIGNNPATINSNSILELESTNKGLLLPRLALTATNNVSPLSAHVTGMVVYNTATAGTAPNNVVPGYYYNTGSSWSLIASSSSFVLPQMALSSSTSPAGTATGQLIYNTATVTGVEIGPSFWNGSSWVNLSSALEPWYNVATTAPATRNTQNIYQMGNVGIGTTSPNAKLDIRSNPTSTTNPGTGMFGLGTSTATATAAGAGAMRYNTTSRQIEYSDGTSWIPFAPYKAPIYAQYEGVGQILNTQNTLLTFPTTNISSGGITRGSGNNTFTLPAGRIYKVEFNPGQVNFSTSPWATFAIYNNSSNAILSPISHVESVTTSTINNGVGITSAFVDATGGAITIDVRFTSPNGGNRQVGSSGGGGIDPYLNIVAID